MKRRSGFLFRVLPAVLLLVVLVIVNLPGGNAASAGAEPGEQLPAFSIICTDGSDFTLLAQRGKVVVINLWATWCAPCVEELPHFDRLLKEQSSDTAVLAVHSPPVTTDVKEYLSDFSYEIPFAVDEDGSLSTILGASDVLPQTVIINPDGIVTYNQSGSLSYEELIDLVNAAKQ